MAETLDEASEAPIRAIDRGPDAVGARPHPAVLRAHAARGDNDPLADEDGALVGEAALKAAAEAETPEVDTADAAIEPTVGELPEAPKRGKAK